MFIDDVEEELRRILNLADDLLRLREAKKIAQAEDLGLEEDAEQLAYLLRQLNAID